MTITEINLAAIHKHREALDHGLEVWPSLVNGTPPALGDFRWTDELILSGWYMAQTGQLPANGLNYRTGRSGGGFDVLDFKFLPDNQRLSEETPVDLTMPLNRRHDGLPELIANVPWYG